MVKRDPNEHKEDNIVPNPPSPPQNPPSNNDEETFKKTRKPSITKEEIEKMIQEALDKFKPQEIQIPDHIRNELIYLFTGRYHQMRTKSPFAIHELDKLAEFFKISETEYKIEKPKKK